MKRNYYLFAIVGLLFFAACDKKADRVFDESPTKRLNDAVANAQSVLKSKPNGWIMQYYPGDDAGLGGFNFFMNFTNSTDVSIQSDYTAGNVTSTYKVYPGAGPILTFDTYNSVLDFFALPGAISNWVNYDVGFGGDIEFLVMKASADSVILKGRKRGTRIVMVPMPANSATVITNYKASFDRINNASGFRFETAAGNTALSFGAGYNVTSLTDNFSFRATETGVEFYNEHTVNGVKFKELTYKPAATGYPKGYYTNTAGTIKFVIL